MRRGPLKRPSKPGAEIAGPILETTDNGQRTKDKGLITTDHGQLTNNQSLPYNFRCLIASMGLMM